MLTPRPHLLSLLIVMAILAQSTAAADECLLFIASPAQPAAIYSCTLDTATGQFGPLQEAATEVQAGFLARHPELPILYAATVEGKEKRGAVRSYRILAGGRLEHINTVETADAGNTHLAVAADGSAVVQCHYGGKGTTALPLAEDGSIVDDVSHIEHGGKSVNEKRQTRPHPHGVAIHPSGRFVCVADLGNDHVEVYRLSGSADLSKHSRWKANPGAGPRHVLFNESGKQLYCINELDSTIDVLDFDDASGQLTPRQTVSTLPDNFDGDNTTAELALHPTGRYLYGSNRGHDSTAVFKVDANGGTLELIEIEPTRGEHPRFVGIEPSGRIYVAANLFTGNLVSFQIDAKTGRLTPSGHQAEVARPMCIAFVP